MNSKDKLIFFKDYNNLDIKINKYYIFYDNTISKNKRKSSRHSQLSIIFEKL